MPGQMLHFGRKKQQAMAAAEAKGASFWTTKFEEPCRVKITYALKHAAADDAYQKALEKISSGEPESAITAAGTALQETLRACGCNGNSIGDLASDARKKGLLARHDPKLASGIQSMIEWVGADRSEKGD